MASYGARRVGLNDIWPELESGVHSLITNLNQGMDVKKWMKLYSSVYDYCASSRPQPTATKGKTSGANFVGEELYNKLKNFLIDHMGTLAKEAESKMDDSLLHYYRNEWDRYTTAMRYINHIFQYLNRHWIKREADDGKKEVYEIVVLSLVIWRDYFFVHVSKRLTEAILNLIEKERNGEQVDSALIKAVVTTYTKLGLNRDKPKEPTLDVYKQHFSVPFLARTEEYYTKEAAEFIAINTISDFMKKVETRLEEEVSRVRRHLNSSTEAELASCCEKVLICKHKDAISDEFKNLLEDHKLDDLSRMYNLLSRISQGLDPLKVTLEKHVQDRGLQAVQANATAAATDPKLYVETLLTVYRKYSGLVKDAFKMDSNFVGSLDKACRRFINENAVCKAAKSPSKSPELLARYTDFLLRKGNKNPEESEMDAVLNDIMVVFKYIEDKDVFQTFYSKMLAKRLIHGTSASEHMEETMIGKLKASCGYEYTSKLQRMFTDMSLSRDLLEKFKNHVDQKSIELSVDFSVLVLATGSWPLNTPSTNFTMPKELQKCEQQFQAFYNAQHSGRKLNWLHQMSKGELKAKLPASKNPYTLQSSTYQIGVLLLFNDAEKLSYEFLQTTTALSDTALNTTIASLMKVKLLAKDGDGDVDKNSTLVLNKSFKSKRAKININVPVPQQVERETQQTQQIVEEDRKLQIQAAVVRIMKARKRQQHSNLISEVVSQLQARFKPKIPLIKKCIDILIEKEYLERVEGQKDMYSYVA